MKLQGFIGPAYQLKSVAVDAQRCVNLYPETIESGSGKGQQVAYLRATPGLTELFDVGPGPIRLVHVENFERDNPVEKAVVYVVSGAQVWACSYQSGAWVTTLCGSMVTSVGPVSAHSIKKETSFKYQTVFVDGDNNYLVRSDDYDGGFTSFGNFASFSLTPVLGATQVVWIDGYLILTKKDTSQFFVSAWSGLTFNALDFATAEGNPDNVVALAALNRDLILFNKVSIEIYTNTGNADFPFERIGNGFIEIGCCAAFSVAKTSEAVFWLGQDASGRGVVYTANSISPQRISTHAIEAKISTYADITTARAYTYQYEGHYFYVLNFAEATWVYDVSTRMWHERAYLDNGDLTRHRIESLAYIPNLGIHVGGDYESNLVYQLDPSAKTDNGDAIKRLRSTPHISSSLKRIFHSKLQVDCETGVGLDGTQQGTDPQLMMRFSNDGGRTWSDETLAAMGKIGEYKARGLWRRLGQARDRVYEISVSDPVDVNFIDAELDASEALN
jgi:Phage stabilisation protein